MSFGVPLGIAGVGLIGGSIALRARERGVNVIGYDRDAASIAALVDGVTGSLDELARRARTVVIALPIDATLEAIDFLRAGSYENLELVIDVASVKVPIARRATGWPAFVPTHPLAGSEQSGPAAARADLFSGRTWAYVARDAAHDAAARSLIESMGAEPFAVEPEQHDRAVTLTSHLPQVVVSALGAMLEERRVPAELAGPGLASTLRLAGSPWRVWETIVRANSATLAEALRDFQQRLSELAQDLEAGEVERAASYFESAHAAYERFVRARR